MTSRHGRLLHFRAGDQPSSGVGQVRLDRWITERIADRGDLSGMSRSRVKNLILDGMVSANGGTIADPSAPVKPGAAYVVTVPPPRPIDPPAQDIALDIVHEDASLLVLDKPAGLAVHPAPGSPDRTLVNALLAHCGDSLSGIGGALRPGIVHRLDKDTSGLLVVAKTDEAHHGLMHQFAARTVERRYLALVWGVPDPPSGRIEGAIGRDPRNRKRMAVTRRGGKPAATRYRVQRRFGRLASVVECQLETGRTHQIRVHMTHIGHAPVGDRLYGSGHRRKGAAEEQVEAARALGRQALHAHTLGFTHPDDGRRVAFRRDVPDDMAAIISKFAATGG